MPEAIVSDIHMYYWQLLTIAWVPTNASCFKKIFLWLNTFNIEHPLWLNIIDFIEILTNLLPLRAYTNVQCLSIHVACIHVPALHFKYGKCSLCYHLQQPALIFFMYQTVQQYCLCRDWGNCNARCQKCMPPLKTILKTSYAMKTTLISPPSIKYCIYNDKMLSSSWILNFKQNLKFRLPHSLTTITRLESGDQTNHHHKFLWHKTKLTGGMRLLGFSSSSKTISTY